MTNDKFSDDFHKGEQALAQAILERIDKDKDVGYIKLMCEIILMPEKDKR